MRVYMRSSVQGTWCSTETDSQTAVRLHRIARTGLLLTSALLLAQFLARYPDRALVYARYAPSFKYSLGIVWGPLLVASAQLFTYVKWLRHHGTLARVGYAIFASCPSAACS